MTSNINEIQDAMRKLKRYMRKYGHLYTDNCREYIADNFMLYLDAPTAPDVLMQIYDTVGCGVKEGSFYNAHLARIQNMYGLDRNIVEVGGGRMPAFANKVATIQQKTKKGTITVYDPDLIITKPKFKSLTLKKEEFMESTDVHSYDLVMGLLPCDATEAIISASCKAQKEFYIAMCGCTHFDFYDPFGYYTPHMYQEYVIQLAQDMLKEYDNGELEVDYLPEEYGIDYPILRNRKK
jgi:hypothetical protein